MIKCEKYCSKKWGLYMKKDVYDLVKVQVKNGFYPLSYVQKEIYNSNDKTIIYNITSGILFNFRLVPSKVQNALNKLVEIHSSFRTKFTYTSDTLVQSILDNVEVDLDIEHSSLDAQALVDSFATPFDLSSAPLLHAKLVFLGNDSSLILLDTHRIIVDETSLSIILRDFCSLYNGENIKANDFEYIDYATWENNFFSSSRVNFYEGFWSNQLKCQNFNLHHNFSLPNCKSYKKETVSLDLSEEYFNSVDAISRENNVSNYSVFLACLYILFYKYTSTSNIVIAAPFSGRYAKELENIIGAFSCITPLGVHINKEEGFAYFIKAVESTIQNAIFNSPYSYDYLQDKLHLNEKYSSLDVMFSYQDLDVKLPNSQKLLSKDTRFHDSNLCFKIDINNNSLVLEFNSDVIKPHFAQSLISHYLFILKQALKNQKCRISDFDIITQEEIRVLEKLDNKTIKEENEASLSILIADKKFYRLDASGKWMF